MRRILAPLVCSVALACSPLMADTNIYKWVDANGVTHFGAQPPANVKTEEVQPRVYAPAAPTQSAEKPSNAKSEPSAKEAATNKPKEMLTISAEQIAAQCNDAQKRLQQLESNPRLMTRTADGQMQRVPEEERQKMMETERARVKEYCE